jgi:hypothetical protein
VEMIGMYMEVRTRIKKQKKKKKPFYRWAILQVLTKIIIACAASPASQ